MTATYFSLYGKILGAKKHLIYTLSLSDVQNVKPKIVEIFLSFFMLHLDLMMFYTEMTCLATKFVEKLRTLGRNVT